MMRPSQPKPIAWIKPERNSPVPMQAQIARWLESLIVAGQLGPGDRLPAEAMLVERLGVSRVTVRLAVDDLVSRGLVSRSHGKGSFVSSRVVRHDLRADQSFFDIVLAKATKPEARLLEFTTRVPPANVATVLGLARGEKAVSIDRLFLSAGRPVVFAANWLAPDAAILSRADVEVRSTASLHGEILNHPITAATISIGAELAGSAAARLLGIRPRSAVLVLTRSRFDAHGKAREHNRFTIDPSAYEFTFSAVGEVPVSAILRSHAA
jgi:GntR family transcriptional regulator